MANNVFERREKKYLVTPEQRRALEHAALSHLAPDAFGTTLITSVYLDTPERSLIARSLEKPLYKEKLRLRTYGEREGEALIAVCRGGLQAAQAVYGDELLAMPVFFELKKKFKGIVYKRRVRMSLSAAWAFAQGASYEAARATYPLNERPTDATGDAIPCCMSEADAYRDRQIARELEAALGRYENLQPACAIFCHRTAWAPIENEEAPRITFDDNLCFLDLFDSGSAVQPIIPASTSVMEIKAAGALPTWLINALSVTHSYPRSFSKYGEAARIMKKGA